MLEFVRYFAGFDAQRAGLGRFPDGGGGQPIGARVAAAVGRRERAFRARLDGLIDFHG